MEAEEIELSLPEPGKRTELWRVQCVLRLLPFHDLSALDFVGQSKT